MSRQSHTVLSVCPKNYGGTQNLQDYALKKERFSKLQTLISEPYFLTENELRKIRWDIIGIGEVRRRGEGLETLKSCHLYYHNEEQDESVGLLDYS